MTMTIAADNGFEVGKSYHVKEGVDRAYWTAGMIVEFIQDDGSDMPKFKILKGNAKCKWPNNETHIYLCDLEPMSADTKTNKPKDVLMSLQTYIKQQYPNDAVLSALVNAI